MMIAGTLSPPGLFGVLAGAAMGVLAGFLGALLTTLALAGLAAALGRARTRRRRPRQAAVPAEAQIGSRQLLVYACLGLAAGLAIVSCGGAPADGGSTPGPLEIGVGIGLLAGVAVGLLAAAGVRSRPEARRRFPAAWLIRGAASLLPGTARERWHEEWLGELSVLPSDWARAGFCLSLLFAMPRMAWTLRVAAWRRRGG
jgi:hypothetical protein